MILSGKDPMQSLKIFAQSQITFNRMSHFRPDLGPNDLQRFTSR